MIVDTRSLFRKIPGLILFKDKYLLSMLIKKIYSHSLRLSFNNYNNNPNK